MLVCVALVSGTDLSRERQDVIPTFQDVFLARELGPYANTSIRQRERKSQGRMLYDSKRK